MAYRNNILRSESPLHRAYSALSSFISFSMFVASIGAKKADVPTVKHNAAGRYRIIPVFPTTVIQPNFMANISIKLLARKKGGMEIPAKHNAESMKPDMRFRQA